MARTVVYLLRQAQTIPVEGVQNRDWKLTEDGVRQAQHLVFPLQTLNITKVYSSPFQRALDTLEPFLNATGLQVEVEEGFAELSPNLGYMPPIEFQDLMKRQWDDVNKAEVGCESIRSCQKRFLESLNKVAKENLGGNILVCSHGTPIASVLKAYDEEFDDQAWSRMRMPDIFKLVSEDGKVSVDKDFSF